MVDFNVIIEKGEDGYFISGVVELPGCRSQAKDIDELMERTKEAIELYLEVEGNEERESEFVGLQRIQIKEEKNEQIASA